MRVSDHHSGNYSSELAYLNCPTSPIVLPFHLRLIQPSVPSKAQVRRYRTVSQAVHRGDNSIPRSTGLTTNRCASVGSYSLKTINLIQYTNTCSYINCYLALVIRTRIKSHRPVAIQNLFPLHRYWWTGRFRTRSCHRYFPRCIGNPRVSQITTRFSEPPLCDSGSLITSGMFRVFILAVTELGR